MAYCPGCGSVLSGAPKFCSQCGASIGVGPSPTSAQPPSSTQPQGKTPANQNAGCIGCFSVIVGIVVLAGLFSMCSGGASSSASSSDSSDTGSATSDSDSSPEPTLTAIPAAIQKKSFLHGVDESISGGMIAGNKLKYVGKDVDLHCTVLSVVDDNSFNAECGEDSDGDPAIILVHYQYTSSLDKGQSVRILGTVEDPTEGVNGYGGEATFPTVNAEFME